MGSRLSHSTVVATARITCLEAPSLQPQRISAAGQWLKIPSHHYPIKSTKRPRKKSINSSSLSRIFAFYPFGPISGCLASTAVPPARKFCWRLRDPRQQRPEDASYYPIIEGYRRAPRPNIGLSQQRVQRPSVSPPAHDVGQRRTRGNARSRAVETLRVYKGEAALVATALLPSSSHTHQTFKTDISHSPTSQASQSTSTHHTQPHNLTTTQSHNHTAPLPPTCSSSVPPALASQSLRLPRLLAPPPPLTASLPPWPSSRLASRARSSPSPRTTGPTPPCGQSGLPSALKRPSYLISRSSVSSPHQPR